MGSTLVKCGITNQVVRVPISDVAMLGFDMHEHGILNQIMYFFARP